MNKDPPKLTVDDLEKVMGREAVLGLEKELDEINEECKKTEEEYERREAVHERLDNVIHEYETSGHNHGVLEKLKYIKYGVKKHGR